MPESFEGSETIFVDKATPFVRLIIISSPVVAIWEASQAAPPYIKALLDRDVGEGDAKAQSAGPPMLRESSQGRAVAEDHQHLSHEDGLGVGRSWLGKWRNAGFNVV